MHGGYECGEMLLMECGMRGLLGSLSRLEVSSRNSFSLGVCDSMGMRDVGKSIAQSTYRRYHGGVFLV